MRFLCVLLCTIDDTLMDLRTTVIGTKCEQIAAIKPNILDTWSIVVERVDI